MRHAKNARTLAYIVQDETGLKPLISRCSSSKDRIIKAIVWDENGWIEIIKRLSWEPPLAESEQEALS